MEAVQQRPEQRVKTPQQWALENLKGLFPNVNRTTIENAIGLLPKFAHRLPVEIFPSLTSTEMKSPFFDENQLKNIIIITDNDAEIGGDIDNGCFVNPKQFILTIQLRGEVQNVKYPHIELFTTMNKRQMKASVIKKVGYIPPRWTFPKEMHIS